MKRVHLLLTAGSLLIGLAVPAMAETMAEAVDVNFGNLTNSGNQVSGYHIDSNTPDSYDMFQFSFDRTSTVDLNLAYSGSGTPNMTLWQDTNKNGVLDPANGDQQIQPDSGGGGGDVSSSTASLQYNYGNLPANHPDGIAPFTYFAVPSVMGGSIDYSFSVNTRSAI